MTASAINAAEDKPYREMEPFLDLCFDVVEQIRDLLDGDAWLAAAPFPHLFVTIQFASDGVDVEAAHSAVRKRDGLFVIAAVPSAWCFELDRSKLAYRLHQEVLAAIDRVSQKYGLPQPGLLLGRLRGMQEEPAPPPEPGGDCEAAELHGLVDDLQPGDALLLAAGNPHVGAAVAHVARYESLVDALLPDEGWLERGAVQACTYWVLHADGPGGG